MTELTLAKVTRKGQMTIPQTIREALDIQPGDYVALRPLMGGILTSKAAVTPEVQAEDVLRHLGAVKKLLPVCHRLKPPLQLKTGKLFSYGSLVVSLGQAAEERGIREDEDLDAIVEEAQRRAYQERYGE